MSIVLLLVFLVFVIAFPHIFVTALFNLHRVIYYAIRDKIDKHRKKLDLIPKTGEIVCFAGYFGNGKTLSGVHHITTIYRRYNGLRVWCDRRNKWVTQVVNVISNVDINGVNYEKLVSMEQFVKVTETIQDIDDKNDTLTITLGFIDEAAAALNNREFRKNFNADTLNSILTVRHAHISLFYSSQKFHLVDSLLRSVTSHVFECRKIWRFQTLTKYDGWQLEQASNPANVQSCGSYCWFIRNEDFNRYNTYAFVDKLRKDMVEGQMMSDDEILALRVKTDVASMEGVTYSKKYKKRHKKLY